MFKNLSSYIIIGAFMACAVSTNSFAAPTTYPDIPVAIKNGAGVKVGNKIYAGLGSAGKAWFSMDLSEPQPKWTQLADFPDGPRDQSIAAAVGGKIYVFGGAGELKHADNSKDMVLYDDVYSFDPAQNKWEKVLSRSPLGLLGAVGVSLDGNQILFFGGVNKAIFDGYFSDLKSAGTDEKQKAIVTNNYFGKRPQDYLFSTDVLSYTPSENAWKTLGKVVYPPTAGPAMAVRNNDITLVNGELKPGLRSYQVHSVAIHGDKVQWKIEPELIAAAGQPQPEGLAGAFSGYSKNVLLVAGGANFPGAWNQYRQGQNYAHRGLNKTWHDDIYALVNGKWCLAGHLPENLGYGLSFQLDDGVLLVGGEKQGGQASTSVFELTWDGKSAHPVTK
ncbi:N-acetylneuraminate epimerase [Glaciimonas soli]|nr:N-acetylneuraminate epimerase [Glaciimonas soli]